MSFSLSLKKHIWNICECDFFSEFCINMYMVGWNEGKSVGNEDIKSMYMLLKHVHDMYMGCHARIVKKSCTSHVYV